MGLQAPLEKIPRHIWEGITQTLSKPARVSEKIRHAVSLLPAEKRVEEMLSETALHLLKRGEGNVIVTVEPAGEDEVQITVFRATEDGLQTSAYTTGMPKHAVGIPLRDLLARAVVKRLLRQDDQVILTVSGHLLRGVTAGIIVVRIREVFFELHIQGLAPHIPQDVLESVLTIARELALEGREGKHVGATFIIGERDNVQPFLRQIILNPFMHYPPEDRRITREDMWETVKNFAQLDGAFLIDSDGTIVTAGAMITLPPGVEPVVLPGFGTRHTSAASLTRAVPGTIAIVVSSSGGTIRIFKDGRIVARLS